MALQFSKMNLNMATVNATIMAMNRSRSLRPHSGKGRPINYQNLVIAFTAIVLNIVEMLMIVCKKRMKPFERILLSLCVADIAVSFFYVLQRFYDTANNKQLYGSSAYFVKPFLENFAITSSITNIIALGVDRLIAVRYPLKHKFWMTKRKINLMVLVAWLSSIALAILCNTDRFINVNRNTRTPAYIFVALVFSFGLMITILYGIIIVTLLRRKKMFKDMHGGRNWRGSEAAVTITCVNVVVVFSICTYPHMVDFALHSKPSLPLKFVLLNSMLDPIVYYFRGYLKKKLIERSQRQVDRNIALNTINIASSPAPLSKSCHTAKKQTTKTVLD